MCYANPPKEATVTWGPELKGGNRSTINNTLGYDDTGYYVSGYEKSEKFIKKLDTKLNLVAEFRFEEKDPATKIRYEYEGSIFYNEKLLLFKSTINRDDKINELYIQELSTNTLTPIGSPKKVAEIAYTKSRNKGSFSSHVSKEEKFLLISFTLPTEKDENEKIHMLIFDETIKLVWQKQIELPYASNLFFTYSTRCSDDGNAYILGKLYKDKVKATVKGQQNFSFHLLAYTDQGNNTVEYEIKLENKFITDISFSVTDNGDIITAGFYSKVGHYSADGAYFMVMDGKTKSVKTTSIKEFEIDFITEGMTEREEAKAKKKDQKGKDLELYQYDLDDLVKRTDGGAVLIGEQFYITTSTYSDGKNTYTRYHYHYHDIIVINIDPAGKIEWAKKISKRQTSTNDGGFYSSYALAVTGDKLRFIFNDHKDNLQPKKQGAWKNYTFGSKDGIVCLVTLNPDGSMVREALLKDSEVDVYVRPKVTEQISDNKMLMFGEKRKKDQFAIVEF